ncbi:hypothetical protein [Moraxella catarrhalis]|uniref:hypothetical protein n=1 Tax=Moraxella catarrhalis TaxID=480 RepID=UPI0007E41D1B|nr:hypothetical protein [Moraxella catarrhalis]OAV06000.1 hypothetical protein AO379_1076 [Moraxella catarrhalis]OAV16578.1 hypothetical protein AO375_0464 [Moraxella catarrhalis]RKM33457.1 hypothetical protein D6D62_06505 [Moraxella catarrhalis]DAX96582.1 MAG TPA: hypothetical protein [Caudoviricetes sp.]
MDYDERDITTYDFLFDLSDDDKKLLIKYTEFRLNKSFSSINQWENWLSEHLKQSHFEFILKLYCFSDIDYYDVPFDYPTIDEVQKLVTDKSNDVEMMTNVWIELLRKYY